MPELQNTFSWSFSRHRAFSTCLRLYWLRHYGSWGGWDPHAPEPIRQAYVQKNLTRRPLWIGTSVHRVVEWVLQEVRRGRYPEPAQVVTWARERAWRDVDASLSGQYQRDPKRITGFDEHYYGEGTGREGFTDDVDEIAAQVERAFGDPVFLRLTQVPGRIREVEQLHRIDVGDVPVWVSPDVVVEDGHGAVVVVDWKTGRSHQVEEVSAQLGVYGVYALLAYFGVAPLAPAPRAPERVTTMYVNLRDGARTSWSLGEGDVDRALEVIRSSAAAMREKLVDVSGNVAAEADFQMLPEGDPACGWCVFRGSCGRASDKN